MDEAYGAPVNLTDEKLLQSIIRERLAAYGLTNGSGAGRIDADVRGSAVLMVLACLPGADAEKSREPCLLLNKRSRKVRQPGDLCYPGGSVGMFDRFLSKMLRLPGFPLARYPHLAQWRKKSGGVAEKMAYRLATSLREAWEEMRLNPLAVDFLGPLPVQPLVMFKRAIFPMVAWMAAVQRFKPNWEVERIVAIPLGELLKADNYAIYRLSFKAAGEQKATYKDFTCFIHRDGHEREILWGATFRMTMDFLRIVFHFTPPEPARLPVIKGRLDSLYLNGTPAYKNRLDGASVRKGG